MISSKVREGISDGRVISDMAFYDPHSLLLLKQFFWFMVSSTYVYLTFELSNTVVLYVSKTAAKESKSWGCVWKSPIVQKSLPLPYPSLQLHQLKA